MNLGDIQYRPESGILILTIDCFRKKRLGTPEYNESETICCEFPEEADRIIKNRQNIFSKLKKREIRWENDLKELPINDNLVNGRDFGGEDPAALYRPAIDRYNGDFYTGLGREGKEKILRSSHHFLIISACFGILKPLEPIQFYACQFGDKNKAYWEWTKKHDITKILVEYVKKHNIKRIFSFMQCDVLAYQYSIKWDLLKKESPELDVLHGYSWKPGDRSLIDFGEYVVNHMVESSEDALMAIESGSKYGDIEFFSHLNEIEDSSSMPEFDPLESIRENEECYCFEYKTSAFGGITPEKIKNIQGNNYQQIFGRIDSCFKIAKTICAFLNSDGGHLFIGVEEKDDLKTPNRITGIESELHKVGAVIGYDRTRDGYGRLIIDGIIKVFFPDFESVYNEHIKIDFLEYDDDRTICWIQAKPSKRPIFMLNFNSRPEEEYQFYVRNDFESQKLDIKGAVDYALLHFDNIK